MRIDWLGYKGFRQLRTSYGALVLIEAEAAKVLAAANSEGGRSVFGTKSTSGRNRAGAIVFTANPAAMVKNAKNNTLVRALGGGGG